MKKIILTVSTVVLLGGMLSAQTNPTSPIQFASNSTKAAVCTWEKTSHDFGKISQGKPVSIVFNFTNTGEVPLILSSVHPSCGCTTEDYTKEAIAPGKKGFVKLTYNAAAVGSFTKTATVNTNTEQNSFALTFTGEVVN